MASAARNERNPQVPNCETLTKAYETVLFTCGTFRQRYEASLWSVRQHIHYTEEGSCTILLTVETLLLDLATMAEPAKVLLGRISCLDSHFVA